MKYYIYDQYWTEYNVFTMNIIYILGLYANSTPLITQLCPYVIIHDSLP